MAPTPNLNKVSRGKTSCGRGERANSSYINPTTAMKMGRDWRGTAAPTTTKLPVRIPALPRPAMARPTIKVIEFGATPQSSEPISNRNRAVRYAFLTEKSMKTRPNSGWKAHAVSRYADPYHPMSGVEWNSWVMYGIAWAVIGQRKKIDHRHHRVSTYRGYDGPINGDQKLGDHEAYHQADQAKSCDETRLVRCWNTARVRRPAIPWCSLGLS